MPDVLADFERLSETIKRMPQGKVGQSSENRYGALYQQLVQLGQRPQLALKYRGPKAMSRYSRGK